MTLLSKPPRQDIRIGSRVVVGDFDWLVTDIETRWYGVYLQLVPPANRPGKNCSLTVSNVWIGDARLVS